MRPGRILCASVLLLVMGGLRPADGQPPVSARGRIARFKKGVVGDFTYRFIPPAGVPTAPAPLPPAGGPEGEIEIPIPDGMSGEGAQIEIVDATHGNLARFPVTPAKTTSISDSSFRYIRDVQIPVQSHGRGVYDVQVTLRCPGHNYSNSFLLKPGDGGVARFTNVPANFECTATLTHSGDAPISQTRTLGLSQSKDGLKWPTISVDWPGVQTVSEPAAVSPPPTDGQTPATGDTRGDSEPAARTTPGSALQPLVSLAMLVAVLYGLFWAVSTGRAKHFLEQLGIQPAPTIAAGAPDAGPVAAIPTQPALPSILEATTDPASGPASGASRLTRKPEARLVAKAGLYSGRIFPIEGPQVAIGRDPACGIALADDANVSRRHAVLEGEPGMWSLRDTGSSNGSFVNGVRLAPDTGQLLRPGDEIQIGMTRFRIET